MAQVIPEFVLPTEPNVSVLRSTDPTTAELIRLVSDRFQQTLIRISLIAIYSFYSGEHVIDDVDMQDNPA